MDYLEIQNIEEKKEFDIKEFEDGAWVIVLILLFVFFDDKFRDEIKKFVDSTEKNEN